MITLMKDIGVGICTNIDPPCFGGDVHFNGAYTARHVTSGRFYVGSTKSLYIRTMQHKAQLRGNRHPLFAFQDAYNLDPNLEWEYCITDTREKALFVEQSVLNAYFHTGVLFNISPNANVAFKGLRHSEETRRHLSEVMRVKGGKPYVGPGHTGQRIRINGVEYASYAEAERVLGISSAVIRYRVSSETDQFCLWRKVD